MCTLVMSLYLTFQEQSGGPNGIGNLVYDSLLCQLLNMVKKIYIYNLKK
uniref:Uncharacterized protein n=1 Tax=Arundo donax TaxID=35708 RepID=A0A0A9ABL0_ARUDO